MPHMSGRIVSLREPGALYLVGDYEPAASPGMRRPFIMYKSSWSAHWVLKYDGTDVALGTTFVSACRHPREEKDTFYIRVHDPATPSRIVAAKATDFGASLQYIDIATYSADFDQGVTYFASGLGIGGWFNQSASYVDGSGLDSLRFAGDEICDTLFSPAPGVLRSLGATWVGAGGGIVGAVNASQWHKKYQGFVWSGGTFQPDGSYNEDYIHGSGYGGGPSDPPPLTYENRLAEIDNFAEVRLSGGGTGWLATPGIRLGSESGTPAHPGVGTPITPLLSLDNGASWSAVTAPVAQPSFNIGSIAGAHDGRGGVSQYLLAMRDGGGFNPGNLKIFSSPDAATWTLRNTRTEAQVNSALPPVCAVGSKGKWLVDGGQYSNDQGATWTAPTPVQGYKRIRSVGRNFYAIIGDNSAPQNIGVRKSGNGFHWTSDTLATIPGAATPASQMVLPRDIVEAA